MKPVGTRLQRSARRRGTSDNSSRWASDAVVYDRWYDRPWGAYATRIEHQLLLGAIPTVDGQLVCDAGCGTGRFAQRLEQQGARVSGVDRDRAALDIAAHRIQGALIEADVHGLPFADDTFDVTFAVTVCEFTASPEATIAELARITRPGGHLVIGSLNRNSPWGWWNRRQFHQPPWNTARFLNRDELIGIGEWFGTVTWRDALHMPTTLPLMNRWGSWLEHFGSRVAPASAAFGVLTIECSGSPRAAR